MNPPLVSDSTYKGVFYPAGSTNYPVELLVPSAARSLPKNNKARFAYNGAGKVAYEGQALAGTAEGDHGWAVNRYTYDEDGHVTDIDVAGDGGYNQVWTDYLTLEYN